MNGDCEWSGQDGLMRAEGEWLSSSPGCANTPDLSAVGTEYSGLADGRGDNPFRLRGGKANQISAQTEEGTV